MIKMTYERGDIWAGVNGILSIVVGDARWISAGICHIGNGVLRVKHVSARKRI